MFTTFRNTLITFVVGVVVISLLLGNATSRTIVILMLVLFAFMFFLGILAALFRRLDAAQLKMEKGTVEELVLHRGFRFYEIGPLYEGHVHDSDILSAAFYYYLNKGKQKDVDTVEHIIIQNHKDPEQFFNLYNTISKRNSAKSWQYERLVDNYAIPIYQKLLGQGFLNYNPRKLEKTSNRIVLITMIFATAILFLFAVIARQDPDYFMLFFLAEFVLFLIGLLSLFCAIFAYEFHEKQERVLPVRIQLSQYRNYLKNKNFFKKEVDFEILEKEMPLFISLRIFRKHWQKMFEYILEKKIPDGVQKYRAFLGKNR